MNYQQQLQDFIHLITNSYVVDILFFEDTKPSFQKEALPFQCKYCYAVAIVTNQDTFLLQTQETTPGISTFLITSSQHQEGHTSQLALHADVKSVRVASGHNGVPTKIDLQFASRTVSLYAAEIYNSFLGGVRCTLNDEMILFFDSEKDARVFEHLTLVTTRANHTKIRDVS